MPNNFDDIVTFCPFDIFKPVILLKYAHFNQKLF